MAFAGYAQKVTVLHFEVNSDVLTKQEALLLKQKADSLDKKCTILVKGHTDSDGSEAFNADLAARRSEVVKAYLQQLGFLASQIDVSSFGESKPLASNQTNEGKTKNRRVEIVWQCMQSIESEPIGDINSLYQQLEPETQNFCINPQRDTVLKCKGGTVININANAFSTPCKKGCVTIDVIEVLNASQALMLRLTTVSNGSVLQSGGMFYLQATDCNGRMLKSKPKQVTVFVPKINDGDMMLFKGSRMADGNMNWHADTTTLLPNFSLDDLFYSCIAGNSSIKKCRFFWCKLGRIDNALAGVFSKKVRANNQAFRQQQNTLSAITWATTCPIISDYFMDLGINSREELLRALGLPPEFEITPENYGDYQEKMNKLRTKLLKEKKKRVSEKVLAGEANLQDLNYYVFNADGQTWLNIDAFLKMKESLLAEITIDIKANAGTACQLVFPNRNILLYGIPKAGKYTFNTIPKNEKATLVVMKYVEGRAFLQVQEITITDKKTYAVNLQEQSLADLQNELRKITW